MSVQLKDLLQPSVALNAPDVGRGSLTYRVERVLGELGVRVWAVRHRGVEVGPHHRLVGRGLAQWHSADPWGVTIITY